MQHRRSRHDDRRRRSRCRRRRGEPADVEAVREAAVGVRRRPDRRLRVRRHGRRRPSRATRSRSASTATSLGLLIGPGGRTLLAIQDLARVAAQRRLGDHDTRLRIDVAGYREKRRVALERFAATVADQVQGVGRRPLARSDAVGRPQGHPRRAGAIDGVTQPVRGRGSQPAHRCRPGLSRSASTPATRLCRRAGVVAAPRDARCRPIADVIEHAGAFVAALVDVTRHGRRPRHRRRRARPGDRRRPARPPVVLVDRRATRTDHLRRLVRRLGLDDRVDGRRDADALTPRSTTADAVVARGFGPPGRRLRGGAAAAPATALIVVSEPPEPSPIAGRAPSRRRRRPVATSGRVAVAASCST